VEPLRAKEEEHCCAPERVRGEVASAVGGVDEVHGARAKLAVVTACPEDGWRRLALLGCSAADQEVAVSGFGVGLRPSSSRMASGRPRKGLRSAQELDGTRCTGGCRWQRGYKVLRVEAGDGVGAETAAL
jgi:hypothetical protein